MITTAKLNLLINQGATFRHKLYWKDGKKKPIDITGYTGRLQARTDYSAQEAYITLTTANGGIDINGSAGEVAIYMSDEQTAALSVLKGVYDLELVAPNGDVIRLVQGTVTLSLEVTKVE